MLAHRVEDREQVSKHGLLFDATGPAKDSKDSNFRFVESVGDRPEYCTVFSKQLLDSAAVAK
jgi:hypothetical protein